MSKKKLTTAEVDSILSELKDHGIAFVDDEGAFDNEDGIYNPLVDKVNAELLIRDRLMEFAQ